MKLKKINLILLFLIQIQISCTHEQRVEVEDFGIQKIDCKLNTLLISNYLNDITTVIRRSKHSSLKSFTAYRRLEALSENNYNIDNLAYIFHHELHSSDSLNNKLNEWMTWIFANKCNINKNNVDSIFSKANDNLEKPNFGEPKYIIKLRVLKGLLSTDESQDSLLIKENKELYNNSLLSYPDVGSL